MPCAVLALRAMVVLVVLVVVGLGAGRSGNVARPPTIGASATCTTVIGLESSGTRFVSRELSRILGGCPPQRIASDKQGHGSGVPRTSPSTYHASGCGWNGELPPCWTLPTRGVRTHVIQHLSLPWGGVCVRNPWYIQQRTSICYGRPEGGRWFLNLTAHLLNTSCKAVLLTRDKIFTRISKLHHHCQRSTPNRSLLDPDFNHTQRPLHGQLVAIRPQHNTLPNESHTAPQPTGRQRSVISRGSAPRQTRVPQWQSGGTSTLEADRSVAVHSLLLEEEVGRAIIREALARVPDRILVVPYDELEWLREVRGFRRRFFEAANLPNDGHPLWTYLATSLSIAAAWRCTHLHGLSEQAESPQHSLCVPANLCAPCSSLATAPLDPHPRIRQRAWRDSIHY